MNAGGLIREESCGCGSPSYAGTRSTRASPPRIIQYTVPTQCARVADASHRTASYATTTYHRTPHNFEMSRHFCIAGVALLALFYVAEAQRRLALPDPRSCANRVRHSTYRDARGVLHSYFFSWEHAPTRNLEVDWLDARNICRRHCMDAVSLETPQENEFIKQRIARGNVRYIWTSGRKCNFAGCDRPDLQPPNVNGWFWSGSGAKIGPTTQRNTGDWSYTGGYGQAQPDNREAAQGNDESCLSILNNFYNDGIKWHDVACHHVKPFVCEDSDELLNFVRSRNPQLRL